MKKNKYGLTDSQIRNLILVYLFPFSGVINGNTYAGLKKLDLVESGWHKDPRLPYERCTAKGAKVAMEILRERLPTDIIAELLRTKGINYAQKTEG